jgi:hypothetical protein
MNPIDDQLDRLFRAAAQHQPSSISAPPYGLETRVMSAWKITRGSNAGFWDMTLLVRGLIVAGLIMVVSFWPALNTTTNPFAEFLQLTDSTIPSDDAP